MKKYFLFLILYFPNLLSAQKLQIINATRQNWSGGVCCLHGTNYAVLLQSKDTRPVIEIDTVWIGGIFFARDAEPRFTCLRRIEKGKATYQLAFQERRDDNNPGNIITEQKEKTKVKPPKYKGQACIAYRVNGRREILAISKFTELQSLAYP